MTPDIHRRTRQYVERQLVEDRVGDDLSLEEHLSTCAGCTDFAVRMRELLRDFGKLGVEPSRGLVERTQVRLRRRVHELEQQEARLRPFWMACVFSVVWTALTMPFVWRGVEWLSERLRLASSLWEVGFAALWVLPGLAAAVVVLHHRPWAGAFSDQVGAAGELR